MMKYNESVQPGVSLILEAAAKTNCHNPRDIIGLTLLVGGCVVVCSQEKIPMSLALMAAADRTGDDMPEKVAKTLEILAALSHLEEIKRGD